MGRELHRKSARRFSIRSFRGREAGRGLGFGLSKCWRIVKLHGGRLEVHSAPGQGATMTLSLPLGTGRAATADA